MKQKSLFFLLAACLLCSCSMYRVEVIALAGFDAEQHFRVSPFSELDVHSAIDVVICDSVSDICAQTDANLMPYLQIAQSGKRLVVHNVRIVLRFARIIAQQIDKRPLQRFDKRRFHAFVQQQIVGRNAGLPSI